MLAPEKKSSKHSISIRSANQKKHNVFEITVIDTA
jgi:hypothetical protein